MKTANQVLIFLFWFLVAQSFWSCSHNPQRKGVSDLLGCVLPESIISIELDSCLWNEELSFPRTTFIYLESVTTDFDWLLEPGFKKFDSLSRMDPMYTHLDCRVEYDRCSDMDDVPSWKPDWAKHGNSYCGSFFRSKTPRYVFDSIIGASGSLVVCIHEKECFIMIKEPYL